MTSRLARVAVPVFALFAMLLLAQVVGSGFIRHVLILGMLFAVLAGSWDLTIGYAGVFNFAHTGFFAVGAYASAIAVTILDWSPWAGMALAATAAVIAAALAFVPALRLRGVYVALATFAFSQLAQWFVISQQEWTGGSQGIVGILPLRVGEYSLLANSSAGYLYAASVLAIASGVFLRWIAQSNIGRSLIAIRDAEEYAQSRGVNVARQQFLAFCLSAIPAGLVGAFYAHYIGAVTPGLFGFPLMALLLSMVWVGGVATVVGPMFAGVLLTFASESMASLGPWRLMLISVLIVVSIVFVPGGLWALTSRAATHAREFSRSMSWPKRVL